MSYIFRRNKTVLGWALGAAFFGGAVQLFGYWTRSREHQNITYTDHYRKAIKLAKANAGVEYLFGNPLEIKGINLRNPEENFTQDKANYLKIVIEGPKGRGNLYIHVDCEDRNFFTSENCVLKRAECQVQESSVMSEDQYKDKRLLVYDLKKHGQLKEDT